MRPMALTLAAAALVALAGCQKTVSDPFPLEVGYQPLEPATGVGWPAGTGADPHPEAIQVVDAGWQGNHWASFGRGYLHASLADVWRALGEPEATHIHGTDDRSATTEVEPFPVSFRWHYTASGLGGAVTVWWDIDHRGGLLYGTVDAPGAVALRFQKVDGTTHVRVQSGSIVATEVEPGVTAFEMVGWVDADQSGQADAHGMLDPDWFGDLRSVISQLPPP